MGRRGRRERSDEGEWIGGGVGRVVMVEVDIVMAVEGGGMFGEGFLKGNRVCSIVEERKYSSSKAYILSWRTGVLKWSLLRHYPPDQHWVISQRVIM